MVLLVICLHHTGADYPYFDLSHFIDCKNDVHIMVVCNAFNMMFLNFNILVYPITIPSSVFTLHFNCSSSVSNEDCKL